ncbi:MAG: mevalonate kinase [Oligoflexales bacterium]
MSEAVRVLVPGKLMLFGEYTVLWGEECLAFCLNSFMEVEARLTQDGLVTIESDLWDEPVILGNSIPTPSYVQGHFIFPLFNRLLKRFPLPGLRLKVCSGWDITAGLGSSSALSLGLCLAVAKLANPRLGTIENTQQTELWECAQIAWENQVDHQGFASGYDIACQLQGGLMSFAFKADQWPASISSFQAESLPNFIQVYSGGKGAPTKGVGGKTLTWIEQNQLKNEIIALMNAARKGFLQALVQESESSMSAAIAQIARLRQFLLSGPCFPRYLEDALKTCKGFDEKFTYKTTGAGGEDAIVVFGFPSETREAHDKLASLGWHALDVNFPCHGAILE